MRPLRSDPWFSGDDEVAMLHRVALASAGVSKRADDGRAVIGIANSSSELNPCNLPLNKLAAAAKRGVLQAGGVPVEFPTISLGEDLMKPSAMLYRNLLSIEIEEMIRANPLDGIILLANCDKTLPGALMGAVSANIPTVLITGGARPPASFQGRRIGTGTDLWRLWDKRRSGQLRDEEWDELEQSLSCGTGACNTMGTASSMAIVSEVLGFMVPGSSTIPTGDSRAYDSAIRAGELAVACVAGDMTPSRILTPHSLANAVKVLHAIGGSTNAIIHLCALAGRAGIEFSLDEVATLGVDVGVLVDVEPCGSGLVQDFDAAGGVASLLRELGDRLHQDTLNIAGQSVADIAASAALPSGALRRSSDPLARGGAFGVLRGTLAPDGAVIKKPSASPALFRHKGPAVVFRSYPDMIERIDAPDLEVDENSVLVLTGCGPVGVPGMPEWGMIPIPAKLLESGVRDMVRISDARMSGTSFGTVVLHVAPEAAIGGPLAVVQDGDMIEIDVEGGRLDLLISSQEFARRMSLWSPPPSQHQRGWPALYRDHVTQAPQGCDLDFLVSPVGALAPFVEPVIGRS
ncbi:MAG: dihydroxy-acid dehydratase [Ferrimicrobium sp.]